MRPDLGDLIAGVQRLLQSEVIPALGDAYVQEQVTYSLLLLEYVKNAWPREHLVLREEHDDLAATLTEVAQRLGALPADEARGLAAALAEELAHAATPPDTTPLDRLLAVDRERRAALERAIALLDSLEAGFPPPPATATAGLRTAIDTYLTRTAGRRQAALQILGIGW